MYFSTILLYSALTFVTFIQASPISVGLIARNVEVPVVRSVENTLLSRIDALDPTAPDWKRDTVSPSAPDWKRDSAEPVPAAPDWRRQPADETLDPLLTGPDW
ncbi:hypothetical protein GALMADRAFT_254731 [Galerina marginata CBS 339.88]|uniref:Uncharacterized protein n=1 Tax=Galerina marginata (strain CBS 339.88) TaxID=685588 RepID=A0A067SKY8_GALM3|nr:hypothetical protein GALMADRAFT_254731 [Galerina marginata CBS 339.88]